MRSAPPSGRADLEYCSPGLPHLDRIAEGARPSSRVPPRVSVRRLHDDHRAIVAPLVLLQRGDATLVEPIVLDFWQGDCAPDSLQDPNQLRRRLLQHNLQMSDTMDRYVERLLLY
jgi:hypothetical protein